MAEVWLIRHAETEWSKAGRHTGQRTDLPLTPRGREVSAALRERLAGQHFDRVFVSPLQRARETARLAGVDTGNAEVREELLEWDYGDYEGVRTAEIREDRPDWLLWHDGAPNGESPEDVAARCDRLVAELDALEGRVCCVAHGHILRALTARWLEQPIDLGARLPLETGSVSILGYERELRALQAWNA
jgi:broad specificity phosphatase PhoE